MDGEVTPAQTIGCDLGDERLVRGSVEALADAEQSEREREYDERRSGFEPQAARLDEQPGKYPKGGHERKGAHAASSFDRARDRQLDDHDQRRVDEEDRADLALADVRLVARE